MERKCLFLQRDAYISPTVNSGSTHGQDGAGRNGPCGSWVFWCSVHHGGQSASGCGRKPAMGRHWRSYARTRRRRARESELGGADPKVCSQARRRLARSKPSRTTLRPTLVSCGITGRSLFCAVKSSPMGASAGAQFAALHSSCSRFEPASRAYPVGLSPATRSPEVGSQPCGAKYPGFCADSKGV